MNFREAFNDLNSLTTEMAEIRDDVCQNAIKKAKLIREKWGIDIQTRIRRRKMTGELARDAGFFADEEIDRIVMFPSREHNSHEKKSAVPFDIGGKQQDSCIWTLLTRRAQEKGLHTEGRHNAEESITVSEHISGTLWCHP
ncbi:hypothetical protein AVEN_169914-1 [Araneus ventricosus]|uniref:Uncharacterized protein n=1 Tax=Araneus ventricosus TaxID=182803 RepID=A0A4Y2EYP1_ARAVE|nr:hypothetical protein AVEN_169914-1 [Araneus ventricosus]